MTEKFTQFSFSFAQETKPSSISKSAPSAARYVPITVLTGLDETEVKNTSVYLLRGLLSQTMKKSVGIDLNAHAQRQNFVSILSQEIALKNTGLDSVFLVRDALLKKTA